MFWLESVWICCSDFSNHARHQRANPVGAAVAVSQRPVPAVAGRVVRPHLSAAGSADDERFTVSTAEVTEVEQSDRVFWREGDGVVPLPESVLGFSELLLRLEILLVRWLGQSVCRAGLLHSRLKGG